MPISVQCQCQPCMENLKETIDYAFKLCGGIGLFFSFTEVCDNCYTIFAFYLNHCSILGAWVLVILLNNKP